MFVSRNGWYCHVLWEPDRGCPDHPQKRREFVAWHGQGSLSPRGACAGVRGFSLSMGMKPKQVVLQLICGIWCTSAGMGLFLAQRRVPGRYINTGPLCLWHGSSSWCPSYILRRVPGRYINTGPLLTLHCSPLALSSGALARQQQQQRHKCSFCNGKAAMTKVAMTWLVPATDTACCIGGQTCFMWGCCQ